MRSLGLSVGRPCGLGAAADTAFACAAPGGPAATGGRLRLTSASARCWLFLEDVDQPGEPLLQVLAPQRDVALRTRRAVAGETGLAHRPLVIRAGGVGQAHRRSRRTGAPAHRPAGGRSRGAPGRPRARMIVARSNAETSGWGIFSRLCNRSNPAAPAVALGTRDRIGREPCSDYATSISGVTRTSPATRGHRASRGRSLPRSGRHRPHERIGERLSEYRCCLAGLRHFRHGSEFR